MTALFADTFYWIALADLSDSTHRRAFELTASNLADVPIITTDEVLGEYLTFFATAHEQMRRRTLANVQHILANPGVRVIPQSRDSFLSGMALYGAARQRLQYSRLHFDADDAQGRPDGCLDKRQTF